MKVFTIDSDVFKRDSTLRAQSRMSDGATGTFVGYFDNLRNELAELTDEEISASINGGNSIEPTDATTDGSSCGGCSIARGQKEYSLVLICLQRLLLLLGESRLDAGRSQPRSLRNGL